MCFYWRIVHAFTARWKSKEIPAPTVVLNAFTGGTTGAATACGGFALGGNERDGGAAVARTDA